VPARGCVQRVSRGPDRCVSAYVIILTTFLLVHTYSTLSLFFRLAAIVLNMQFIPFSTGAASIGQVHLARLKHDGSRVVVKVQYVTTHRMTNNFFSCCCVLRATCAV
jgi:hypothetical protein